MAESSTKSWREMFSRNANGVRAMEGSPASAPTPLALGLNVGSSYCLPLEVTLLMNTCMTGLTQ